MARINQLNYLDVVDDVWTKAKDKGIMHVNSEEREFTGKSFKIRGEELINFGTCGYLALEKDPRLLEGAQGLLKKYGSQLSMSRAYMRPPYIQELENLMSQIFGGHKVITFSSTSNAHISVIATIMKPDDLIILDQQVHFSVQFPSKHTRLKGTTVKMVKHSDWDALEDMLKTEYNNYERIWYMADGVYSMHGDLPDTDRLKELYDKYPKLHLYFDDAHGMGWDGKNGAGYIFDRLGVTDRIVLISTLAKGFGSVGGTAVFGDEEMYRRTDIFGGPLSYSHPLSPANVGAAIASAKIHLSDEIYSMQNDLNQLKNYLNYQLDSYNLPNISSPDSPIYLIGSGLNKVTRNFVNRVFEDGIYVNTATFPVVPNDRSGLRFTLTRHNTFEDIDRLAKSLSKNLSLAINEEGDDIERVYEEFGVEYKGERKSLSSIHLNEDKLNVSIYNTISEISVDEWDEVYSGRGNFTHSGLQAMEDIFSKNDQVHDNYSFHYVIVRNEEGTIVASTFFTGGIIKDDMLAAEGVSRNIEKEREKNPLYLCSKTLLMGSMFAEGEFLYYDVKSDLWSDAVKLIVKSAENIKKEIEAEVLILCDFEHEDPVNELLENEGFTRLIMPNKNIINGDNWSTYDELMERTPSKNNRMNIKRYALKLEEKFDVEIKKEITDDIAERYHELFANVKSRNFGFNFFIFPEKTPKVLSKYDDWEFIELRPKGEDKVIASLWCFVGENFYCPLLIGLDYDYSESHRVYQQGMFQAVKRGNKLQKENIFLGYSADFEKQKYGAKSIPVNAYIKVDSLLNMEIIESYSST